MKVRDLKNMLEDYLSILEEYPEEQDIDMKCNTYRLDTPFLATREGYINLDFPVKEEDDL